MPTGKGKFTDERSAPGGEMGTEWRQTSPRAHRTRRNPLTSVQTRWRRSSPWPNGRDAFTFRKDSRGCFGRPTTEEGGSLTLACSRLTPAARRSPQLLIQWVWNQPRQRGGPPVLGSGWGRGHGQSGRPPSADLSPSRRPDLGLARPSPEGRGEPGQKTNPDASVAPWSYGRQLAHAHERTSASGFWAAHNVRGGA